MVVAQVEEQLHLMGFESRVALGSNLVLLYFQGMSICSWAFSNNEAIELSHYLPS